MNKTQVLHKTLRAGSFCARHCLALFVTVGTACALWTVIYFALLFVAFLTGSGVGGLLTYPIGLILIFLATTAISLLLLLPSTVLAEWFARRRGFPILAQIPLSLVAMGLLCLLTVAIPSVFSPGSTFQSVLLGFGFLYLVLLVPLGFYWWVAQSVPMVLSIFRSLLRFLYW
jgi:hypothetical protein